MIEGFWTATFQGGQGAGGGGVAVFSKGRVFGGDSAYTYEGTYEMNGNSLTARIHVGNFLPGMPNVMGVVGNFDLTLSGNVQDQTISASGSLANNPTRRITVTLNKCNAPR
jgi:hypothetical protein